MAIGDIKTFTITYPGDPGLELVINAIDLGGGKTTFEIQCVTGYADINALYWHDGVDDGSVFDLGTKKDNSLNMNGTGEDWDGGIKLSSTGLGKEGDAKSTYLQEGEFLYKTVDLDWSTLDTLGVRATSTSTAEGSIKGVADEPVVTDCPHIVIDDVTVTEGVDGFAEFTVSMPEAYLYDVTITYSTEDGTAGSSDYTAKTGTITIPAGQTSATIKIAILDDTNPESTETFVVKLTKMTADLPGVEGTDDIDLTACIADHTGVGTILDNDNGGTDPGGGGSELAPQTALSHGYWMNHPLTDSEGFADNVGSLTFDAFFNLDDPLPGVEWEDGSIDKGTKIVLELEDLTFEQAVAFGNGSNAGADVMVPETLTGEYQRLVSEAATAVLNFYDTVDNDSGTNNSASFVEWYIYLRNLTDNDLDATNNPTNATEVLADLIAQVDATLSGDAGAYTVEQLTDLLEGTHH